MTTTQSPTLELLQAAIVEIERLKLQCAKQIIELAELEGDRDSWAQQASDRLDDAVTFARERDTLRAELAALKAPQEPVAFMWQHAETGRTGFVAADFDVDHWREHNPRLRIISRCYRAPVPAAELTDEQILAFARLNTPKGYDCDWWQEDRPLINTVRAALASKRTP